MKKIVSAIFIALSGIFAISSSAQVNEPWEDVHVNSLGRLHQRATSYSYHTVADAPDGFEKFAFID